MPLNFTNSLLNLLIGYLNLKVTPDTLIVFLNFIDSVLQVFRDLFTVPRGLPPVQEHDHRIPLILGTAPVNVPPYRYPYF